MKQPRFFYRFTKGQQKGIIALLAIIVVTQIAYYVVAYRRSVPVALSSEEKAWVAQQAKLDSLKAQKQTAYAAAEISTSEKNSGTATIYPFNPNFISEYKAALIGLTPQQYARLQAYRAQGKYVDTAEDFQKVTGIHDTLLKKLTPLFKWPDWVVQKQRAAKAKADYEAITTWPVDINEAFEEDLEYVNGIGPVTAKKIMRYRAALGAFVSLEQLQEIKLSKKAFQGIKEKFVIKGKPQVRKININTASEELLAGFPYFNEKIAKAIITERSKQGKISNIDELSKINDIFRLKSEIISLYLEY